MCATKSARPALPEATLFWRIWRIYCGVSNIPRELVMLTPVHVDITPMHATSSAGTPGCLPEGGADCSSGVRSIDLVASKRTLNPRMQPSARPRGHSRRESCFPTCPPFHFCRLGRLFFWGLFAACLSFAPSNASARTPKDFPAGLRTITTAEEAHTLTTEQAKLLYPVHLRGVVAATDPSTSLGHAAMFVCDATGCVYVMISDELNATFPAGTLVDLQGVTYPGSFAPLVVNTHVRVLGISHPPASPSSMTLSELETGAADAEWVEVEGIVHAVIDHPLGETAATRRYITLQLAMTEGIVGVSMLWEPGVEYSRLVDAKVRIRANAAPMFNRNDQMMGVRLMAPGFSTVQVMERSPVDAFRQPTILIDKLLRWDHLAAERHRVHIRGRVTMLWPGSSFCIRDASRGICAQTTEQTHLALGEIADVVGFAAAEDGTPILTDAVYKSGGDSEPVAARPLTAQQALLGDLTDMTVQLKSRTNYDSELIQVEGQLINRDMASSDMTLLLTADNIIFTAILPRSLAGPDAADWKVGSRLRVTGICSDQLDSASRVAGQGVATAKSFRVLMRSSDDVIVLRRPSWWTPAHAVVLLALILTGTLVVLAWVVVLKRRVSLQALLLRESEERFRHMALHDGLTGLATRLLLQDRLDVAFENAKRLKTGLAVLMLDMDKFKEINDTLGHAAGDEVLQVAASRIRATVRKSDTVARWGGDEFVVLLTDLSNPEMAKGIAKEIMTTLKAPFLFEGRQLQVTLSVGVCVALASEFDANEMLKNADLAMYKAKALGRNRMQVFTHEFLQSMVS